MIYVVELMLLVRATRRCYAEHFVVALHLLAFSMAAIQILVLVHGTTLLHVFVPPADWHNALLTLSVHLVMTVYIVIALRRNRRPVSRLRRENVYIYRPVLFLTVFALT